ncbi:RsmB/NOP family class I SAM-dependent RNA methyltransferase [Paramicrobacterium agarici]|uniref:RsmB/NOP family class I SAM-dependent RNA methyltransferase n=1 Tax=Paramicrobacterium agarici TaxID=630514 RepID=UPI00114F5B57|nr:transcription antitermination factor NusB [Microbacterium agarici]TQO21212.1 16S rRNA (cytosine967-C5)-methyltransferase [Microbacterium agarici]
MSAGDRTAGPRRRRGSTSIQASRLVAFDVLMAVDADEAYANLLLPHEIARASLAPNDAALATELCYGTLRRRGHYDAVIENAAHRPIDHIDMPVRNALRLGAHQLLATRVAPHAAVNESVALARRFASHSSAGFVNGVLRTISRDDDAAWTERLLADVDDAAEALSIEHAHPAWIVRAFRTALEAEGRGDELSALLRADNEAPRVNLVALPGRADLPQHAEPNRYSPVGFRVGTGDPDAVVGRSEGTLRVQDEGSQLAALMLTRVAPVREGERWLDLCAGPGGKSALLAAEAASGGATLVANEVTPARAELVRRATAPFAEIVDVVTGDGRDVGAQHPDSFDRVLVDAPCTGLGALRRRPEARWRKRPNDVAELSALQAELLRSAIAATAPGGTIAYVTCSPHLGETRAIVGETLRRMHDTVTAIDAPEVLRGIVGDIDLGAPDPDRNPAIPNVQLWPHRHGTDAMYVALLHKADR